MKNYEDNQKPNRKKNFGIKKKKFSEYEDENFVNKSNKEFKHKRRSYIEEDEDWKNWDLEDDK